MIGEQSRGWSPGKWTAVRPWLENGGIYKYIADISGLRSSVAIQFRRRHCAIRAKLNQDQLTRAGIGNFFRPSQLERFGIPYHQLRRLESEKYIERIGWGLYRFADADSTELYSIASVCARVPSAIVCLLSALQVYEIGTQLPHEVWIAIGHKARPPVLATQGVRLVRFSGAASIHGIADMSFEGVPARITSPSRTIVDCFRFERLIGREAAVEALKESIQDGKVTIDELARMLRVLPSRRLSAILESGVL